MKSILKTTGLISLTVWAFFLIMGLILHRPFICIISGLFFLLALFRRNSERRRINSAQRLWENFIKENDELREYPYHIWKFADDSEYRKNIIARIFDGEVCGESYSVNFFEANSQPLPEIGTYNIVCDMTGQAYFIVKTVAVIPCCFGQVTPALARMEGCSSVQQWRRFNERKYRGLCDRMEAVFSEELPLIFERFEIVYTEMKKEGN